MNVNNADWDCFKTPILHEILRTQNLRRVEHCAFFGSNTFVPISWMCKKQASVSHSSTESEIISLDARLRMDGIPALELWALIVSVFVNTTQNRIERGDPLRNKREVCSPPTDQNNQVRGDPNKFPTRKKIHGNIDDLNNVDLFPQT